MQNSRRPRVCFSSLSLESLRGRGFAKHDVHMKSAIIVTTLLVASLSACATPQPTRVVFVNPPKVVKSSTEVVTATSPSTRMIEAAFVATPKVTAATLQSNYAAAPTSQTAKATTAQTIIPQEMSSAKAVKAMSLANPETCVRGYGKGVSTDESTAMSEAMLEAKVNLVEKVSSALRTVMERVAKNMTGATKKTVKTFAENRALATIGRVNTVCFYSVEEPMHEFAVCIEVKEADIHVQLGELLDAMQRRDVEELQTVMQSKEFDAEVSKKEMVDNGTNFAASLVKNFVGNFLSR